MYLISLFILIITYLMHSVNSDIIDNFETKGDKNTIGYDRKYRNSIVFSGKGLLMQGNGLLYESLAFGGGPVSLMGKFLRFTYSSRYTKLWKLTLLPTNQKKIVSKHTLALELDRGSELHTDIFLNRFVNTDLSQVTTVIVRGQMLLHSIELYPTSLFPVPIPETSTTPQLLIDDFGKWFETSINTLRENRQFSENVLKGLGSLTLTNENEFLIEHFAPKNVPMKLQFMAFRFLYSSKTSVKLTIGILHSPDGTKECIDVCDVLFPGGACMELQVPVAAFIQSNPHADLSTGYGIKLYGPIVIDSIQLGMNKEEKDAILKRQPPDSISKETFMQMDIRSFRMDLDVTFKYLRHQDKDYRLTLFFDLIPGAIITPVYNLFEISCDSRKMVRIIFDPNVTPEYLDYYRFVGRLLGMMIIRRHPHEINFIPIIYKILLDQPPSESDLNTVNPYLFEMVQKLLNHSRTAPGSITMSLKHENNETDKPRIVDLVPNGRNIVVNEANLHEFKTAYIQFHIDHFIGKQASALRHGFYEVIPRSVFEGFTPMELKDIMRGHL